MIACAQCQSMKNRPGYFGRSKLPCPFPGTGKSTNRRRDVPGAGDGPRQERRFGWRPKMAFNRSGATLGVRS